MKIDSLNECLVYYQMYRELARAREISQVTKTGALTIGETGKAIKKAYERHQREPELEHEEKINHFQKFLDEYLPIIKLSSVPFGWWNFFDFLVIYYSFISNLFIIFILFVFDQQQGSSETFNVIANYSLGFVLLVDMLFIRWRCQYVGITDIQRTHSLIAERYFKYYFGLDFIILFTVIMDLSSVNITFWKLIIYFKIFSYQQIKEQIYAVISGYQIKIYAMFEILRLMLFVALWSFFYSCVYVTIEIETIKAHDYFYLNGHSWLASSPAVDFLNMYQAFPWYVWFQYALFTVLQMVRGAGMGVPAPQSPTSVLWYCICNMNMTPMFWYFTSKVIELIASLSEQQNEQERKLMYLIDIRDESNLPIKQYQKYQLGIEVGVNSRLKIKENQNKLNSMLSSTLWKEFNYGMKQHFILSFQFLRHIVTHSFSEELFRIELSQIIKSKIVYENEVLYARNHRGQQRLYLSEDSELIIFNDEFNLIEELPKWSFAGVREFFVDSRSHFDVLASEFSMIEYIDKAEFEAVVKMYPMVHESYCELIDEMLIQRSGTQIIQLACYHCGEYHLSEDCHRIAIDKSALMNKYRALRYNSNRKIDFPTQNLIKEDIPFFRSVTVSRKVHNFSLNQFQIDQYARRGFSYLNYNIEKVQFHRKIRKQPAIQSEMFRLSNHSITHQSSKNLLPFQDSLTIIPIKP